MWNLQLGLIIKVLFIHQLMRYWVVLKIIKIYFKIYIKSAVLM